MNGQASLLRLGMTGFRCPPPCKGLYRLWASVSHLKIQRGAQRILFHPSRSPVLELTSDRGRRRTARGRGCTCLGPFGFGSWLCHHLGQSYSASLYLIFSVYKMGLITEPIFLGDGDKEIRHVSGG